MSSVEIYRISKAHFIILKLSSFNLCNLHLLRTFCCPVARTKCCTLCKVCTFNMCQQFNNMFKITFRLHGYETSFFSGGGGDSDGMRPRRDHCPRTLEPKTRYFFQPTKLDIFNKTLGQLHWFVVTKPGRPKHGFRA